MKASIPTEDELWLHASAALHEKRVLFARKLELKFMLSSQQPADTCRVHIRLPNAPHVLCNRPVRDYWYALPPSQALLRFMCRQCHNRINILWYRYSLHYHRGKAADVLQATLDTYMVHGGTKEGFARAMQAVGSCEWQPMAQ